MKKSVKILVKGRFDQKKFETSILDLAIKLSIQGTLQKNNERSNLICAIGEVEKVESLIDEFYSDEIGLDLDEVEIWPMEVEKDFRGIFRIVNANE